jgi:HD superfamily phosphodiesterase
MRLTGGGDPLIVQAAAILHDVGILEAERKYGSSAGKYQEIEGPPMAEKILKTLQIDSGAVEHICKIIGSHHSGGDIDTHEFKIVWDADLLANIREQVAYMDRKELKNFINKMFKTKKGKEIAMTLFVGADI